METKNHKKVYRKPRIISEKVFEQAALTCSLYRLRTDYYNLKNDYIACGYAHS